MKTKNALILESGEFVFRESEVPQPGPDEVVVKVAACGICGTDLNLYGGRRPSGWKIEFPFQMGHELAGIIHTVGADVPDKPSLRVGARVVPDGRLPCGYCRYCRRGHENLCVDAGYIAGGFGQYAVYPFKNLVPVPDGVDLIQAAFAEPLACCINGNNKLIDIPMGGFGVVMGSGPIGLIHVQLLKSRGMQVIAVDLKPGRVSIAGDLGANYVLQANKPHKVDTELIGKIKEITGGYGADVVVSAAGLDPTVLEEAFQMSAKQGQVLYFAATLSDPATLNLDVIHYKELRFVGTHDSTRADYEKAVALLQSGNIKLDSIISHRFPLDDINQAFAFANRREGLKVMVVNDGS